MNPHEWHCHASVLQYLGILHYRPFDPEANCLVLLDLGNYYHLVLLELVPKWRMN